MEIEVYKFGGNSLGSVENMQMALGVVANAKVPTVVVVSAMGGITDQLISAALKAARGDITEANITAESMRMRYKEAIESLINNPDHENSLTKYVEASILEFISICQSLVVLGEYTPRIIDAIVSRGERFSALLFSAAMHSKGAPTKSVDGTELIILQKQNGVLTPDLPATKKAASDIVGNLFKQVSIIVVPGFIGKGPSGEVRTLGRGGSDYSATLLAQALQAKQVTLYKDVDGVMTADPNYVTDARIVPELHYREAAELAYYGARVLHPRSVVPLLGQRIPLRIRSFSRPHLQGTTISAAHKSGQYPVKALTAMTGQSLISVDGSGMIGVPGIAARAFASMAQARISVSFISQSSSEASICFIVPDKEAPKAIEILEHAFKWELQNLLIDKIGSCEKLATLAVVGMGMVGTPGIAARTFSALADANVNIVAIAQGASELNISFTVDENDVGKALTALHKEYRLHKLQALSLRKGKSVDLCLLGFGQIGRTLASQIVGQQNYFTNRLQIDNRTFALADRSGMILREKGFNKEELQRAIEFKNGKGSFIESSAAADLQVCNLKSGLDKVFDLPLARGVFVDVTAGDTIDIIMKAVEHNFHVVLANKKPLAVNQEAFDSLMELSASKGSRLRYEATVGAGLPILDTLSKLSSSGDQVISITGCLSGTLGCIMTMMEDGLSFSQAVMKAHQKGFTEPDPREDLSGIDVARKALILARTLGLRLNLDDIDVKSLYREDLSNDDPSIFLENLKRQDEEMHALRQEAEKDNKVLRYVASIADGTVKVGLESLAKDSPLARLRGTNNQVTICSERYRENPLIVTGPGAGAEVTAAGVLNDIIGLALMDE